MQWYANITNMEYIRNDTVVSGEDNLSRGQEIVSLIRDTRDNHEWPTLDKKTILGIVQRWKESHRDTIHWEVCVWSGGRKKRKERKREIAFLARDDHTFSRGLFIVSRDMSRPSVVCGRDLKLLLNNGGETCKHWFSSHSFTTLTTTEDLRDSLLGRRGSSLLVPLRACPTVLLLNVRVSLASSNQHCPSTL